MTRHSTQDEPSTKMPPPSVRVGLSTLASAIAVGLLLSACAPASEPASLSPTRIPPSPTVHTTPCTPTNTPDAARTATPTPSAPPDPEGYRELVSQTVGAGRADLRSRDIEPLCLRWEDTDGDGEAEWVGLHLRPGDPPRLEGFVLDGDLWYELTAPAADEHGLGTFPACELEIDDINLDGQPELLVRGRTTGNVDLLHIFVWHDLGYGLLASFRGDAGIEIGNIDGSLPPEIVARWDAGDGLSWEQVHAWDGMHYGWTWERYGWLYADHPHSYVPRNPERAVICYYLALDGRDLPTAYRLLSPEGAAVEPYAAWARAFDTVLAVEVGSVHEIDRDGSAATVTAQVRSYDKIDGYAIGTLWDVTWTLVYDGTSWRLADVEREQLERWEATYLN